MIAISIIAYVTQQPPRLAKPWGLSTDTVQAIKSSTDTSRACAKRFGVAQSTVVRIRNGTLRTTNRTRTILSDADVEEMRVRHEELGWPPRTLQELYGLSRSTVQHLLHYRRR